MQRAVLFSLVLLLCANAALAQTQASCTFTFLPMKVTTPNLGAVPWNPRGINDFGTVVGGVTRGAVDHSATVGIIRWPGGGVTAIPKTAFVARNNKGITIGYAEFKVLGGTGSKPILLNGTTISDITLNGDAQIEINSINKWGTIVGAYSGAALGFKRWRHGGFINLGFPGSGMTVPLSINDNGTVVGYYVVGSGPRTDGFIYDKGQWATLNLPNVLSTALVGITNAGVIIGTGYKLDGATVPLFTRIAPSR
jgi:hypothetical protein